MATLKAPKPWQQGRFDSLCGIYSVLNCIQLLRGRRFSEKEGQDAFSKLSDRVCELGAANAALGSGLPPEKLKGLFDVSKALDVPFGIKWESVKLSRGAGIDDFWKILKNHIALDRGKVAILSLKEPIDHWSPVWRATDNSLTLANSIPNQSVLLRRNCRLSGPGSEKNQLEPSETFLITRYAIGSKLKQSA